MGETVIPTNVIICSLLMTVAMVVAYATKKYHLVYLPESASAMILGMIFGGIALFLNMTVDFSFSPEIFFYGLLPIIIFNAGYALKKKDFFRNITAISLFAVLGTIISALVYGLCTYYLYTLGWISSLSDQSPLLEALMYGSLMSAIDPVATLSIFQDMKAPPALYNLVFGESLVNDASSIVLFKTFELFMESEFSFSSIGVAIIWFWCISVGSVAMGVAISLGTSLLLKHIDMHSEHARYELAFILMSAYLSYAMAELVGLSGIMSLFLCGICNSHYSYYNISHASKVSSRYAFESLSFMAELFVFAYLGMQVVFSLAASGQAAMVVDRGLLLSSLPICFLSRACNIFPLSWLANLWRTDKINDRMQAMMWFSGLRGAIAYALALNMPTHNPAILSTTLFVVVTTSILMGGLTSPLLSYLHLSQASAAAAAAPGSAGHQHQLDMPLVDAMDSMIDIYTKRPATGFHRWFKEMDDVYIKPVFGGKISHGLLSSIIVPHAAPRPNLQTLADSGFLLAGYDGLGFSVSLPADWEEVFESAMEDTVLMHVCLRGHGVVDASVRVTWYQTSTGDNGLEGYKDAMDFLSKSWQNLDFGINDDIPSNPKGMPKKRILSLSQFVTDGSMANCSDGVESDSADPAGLDFLVAGSRDSLAGNDSAILPLTRSTSGHVLIPAFVMWADSAMDPSGQPYFRYEMMLHPEDMAGSHRKAQIQHLLLSVTTRHGFLYCCQVKGTEAWWSQGGASLAKAIVRSFSLSNV